MAAPKQNINSILIKYIGIFLTVITMAIGAVVWASSEHSALKDWTTNTVADTKSEVREEIKEHYVQKQETSRIEQQLKDQKDDIKEIKSMLSKVLDKLHNIGN